MSKWQVSRHATDVVLDEGRGVRSATADGGRRAHVAGCAVCRAKVNVWKSFAGLAERLRAVEPPADVVERAKALASRMPRVTPRTRLNTTLGYDSVWIPLAAGIRGASPDQTVYQAEEFSVDLRVSRERAHVVILGQVTNVQQPARRLAHVQVELRAGDRVVVRTLSNNLGEFHLEHRERDRMSIEVMPQEGRFIRIPLRPGDTAP